MTIVLTDEGTGIEEDLIPFLFSPGFTTKFDKDTGQASTGIGLSHIQNILEELNGTINIQSVVNKGSTFEIVIPLNSLRR
jgi:two-component system sensor histidine kinase YcbA